MLRTTIRTIGALAFVAGLATCTTGPQVQKPIDGTYNGSMGDAPKATLVIEVDKNGNITGTGDIKADDLLFRTAGGENDIVISGSHDGPMITTMTATISFEYNTTPGGTATWVAGTGEMSFQGEFTKNGAVNGSYAGTTTIVRDIGGPVLLGGYWVAAKDQMGSGILKP